MTEDPKIEESRVPADQGVSHKRRNLLKAAAAAAPMMATLPTGAPRANASIHECVTQAAQADQSMIDWSVPAGPDPYVRTQAKRTHFTGGRFGLRYTFIGITRDEVNQGSVDVSWWRQDLVDPSKWVKFDPDALDYVRDELNDDDIDVLVLFKLDSPQGTGFDIVGVWPDKDPMVGTQFGVVQSCLCSVDPGIAPWCV